MEPEPPNFISVGDISCGGRSSHSELIEELKKALKDKTISKYLKTTYKKRTIISSMVN